MALMPRLSWPRPTWSDALVCLLAVIYMAVSTGLITFNKYLMREDRFPYAIFIGGVHMACCCSFNLVLLHARPSFYPSLTDPQQRVTITRGLIVRTLLPIAMCFAAQLILSNMAFLGSSVAFLQMMKQSNVILVYMFSLVLELEQFHCKRVGALLLIFLATALTIHGEMNFSSMGFTLQAISMVCESVKLTLQSQALSSAGLRLDALTYVMLIAPLVVLIFSALLLAFSVLWPSHPTALSWPPWSAIVEYRWLLLGSGSLGIGMNIVHALFIKHSSAIVFILTGVIMKDVVIVCVGALILGELLSAMQVTGFAMQLVGVAIYSFLKVSPTVTRLQTKVTPEHEALRGDEGCREMECHPLPKPNLSTVSSVSTVVPSDDSLPDDEGSLEGL